MGLFAGVVLPFRGHIWKLRRESSLLRKGFKPLSFFIFYGPVHPIFGYDSEMNSQQLLTHLDAMVFPTIIHAQQCSIGF